MLTNLINLQKLSFQTINKEIAKAINTTVENIIKVELWQHQIWVNISGKGGRIVSYRSLSPWLQEIIFAIQDCNNLEQLQQLGDFLKVEIQRFSQYYPTEYLQKLRKTWGKQRDYLQQEKERTQATREHEQKAQEWLETWQKMIYHWQSIDSVQYLYREMERQSKEFADLPGVIEKLQQTFQKKLAGAKLSKT